MEANVSPWTGLFIGIGLSAACGFRILLPLLGLGLATLYGLVEPAPAFRWIGTWPALTALATAALLEIAAYFIPWLDNVLDAAATPLAMAAGTLSTVAFLGELDPFLRWAVALIAGGGTAGLVQTGTTLLRGLSTTATGGLGNASLAAAELAGALLTTLLALIAPLIAFTAAGLAAAGILWALLRRRRD